MINAKEILEFASAFKRLCENYPNCDIRCPFNRNCPTLKTVTEEHIVILNNWLKENPPKHYAVILEWADADCSDNDGIEIIAVKHSRAEALEIFERQKAYEKEYLKQPNCSFDCYEESEDRYEAWAADDYPHQHTLLYIQEVAH